MTQNERVLWYLQTVGSLTSREASKNLGVDRLAARIEELRRKGNSIETCRKKVKNRFGEEVYIAEYRIEKDEP